MRRLQDNWATNYRSVNGNYARPTPPVAQARALRTGPARHVAEPRHSVCVVNETSASTQNKQTNKNCTRRHIALEEAQQQWYSRTSSALQTIEYWKDWIARPRVAGVPLPN